MDGSEQTGALEGIRVLELGSLIAGPFAGRLLGDLGADVIKVEAPDRPDPLRDWGLAEQDGHRFFWTVHARNKRCITLDLRVREGQQVFLDLVGQADVVLENFRPGTLERWGLGFDILSERNPGIVLARVSGYGQTGPLAGRAGYGSVAEAVSGLRHLNGYPDQPPPRIALSIGDTLAGMFAVQGVLAALLARTRTGRGQVVDVALNEACLAVQESAIPDYDRGGIVRGPSGTRLEGVAPSNLYATRGGGWILIAANQDTVFARLCAVMGRPDLAEDERYADHLARGRNHRELDELISAWVAEQDPSTLVDRLTEVGVVAGPVNTVADVVGDPQLLAREMIVDHYDERIGASVRGPGVVPKLSGTPGSVRFAGAPTPGAHNAEVYCEVLGRDADEQDRLRAAGVI
ncbi:CaiB/BaiF CoA transferase family protein [Rhodococcus sp. NPDC058514]|uniref:CaiB/BaiF CoA transferase family protein n=1 Tax=unclassified Rhodococcus (in: high G+C Gram-positive bacteria) TaxID=192944 RepID=UPI00364C3ED4